MGSFQKGMLGTILGLWSLYANAVGTPQWSGSLTSTGTGTTYYTSSYPTKDQAIAAMKALDPADDTSGVSRALLTEQSATIISASAISYSYAAPSVQSVLSPPIFQWPGTLETGTNDTYSTEAAAAAASVYGYCPSDQYYYASLWLPTGNWIAQAASGSQWNRYSREYSFYRKYPPDCSPALQAATWSPDQLLQYQQATCPPGYTVNWQVGGPPPWPCKDNFTGTITGNILECPDNGSPSTSVGDPCDVATGDLSETETDYSGEGISFTRYYHSAPLESHHALGVGWTHNYAAYLVLSGGVPGGLLRPNGHHDAIQSISGAYISLSGASVHVVQSGSNWVATLKDGSTEIYNNVGRLIQRATPGGMITTLNYNSSGQLSTVNDAFGHSLQLGYNAAGQINLLIDPAGKSIAYGYDANNNLTTATYQDTTTRTYLYENSSFPHNLTGITDENNSRFLTVTYDTTSGVVRTSSQAGGAQAVSILYNSGTAVVTDPLGTTDTYTFTNDTNYASRVTAYSHGSLNQSFTVPFHGTDLQRRVTQSTDANGNITKFTYDPNHLTAKTEAYGTSLARTTSYQYLSTSSALPTLITEASRTTAYAYFAGTNNVQTKTITDLGTSATRAWNYTYNSYGKVLTIDGPRTDVSDITTYTYYSCTTGNECGQLNTVKDALGRITTFNTYNAFGQPLKITDPNNVVTTLTYDARQRLLSRQVGAETTQYGYFPTGLLKTVTLPDSSALTYGYDGAHRLTDITDSLGNHIHYTLDAAGNRTAENAYDPSSTLRRTHSRVFNALGELYQDINAAASAAVTTTYGYDSQRNQTSVSAPLSRNTSQTYDALNRPSQFTDASGQLTQYAYDYADKLTSVIDTRSNQTSWTYNGFEEVTKQVSPDTGTSIKTYDSGGNLKTFTDARSALATYTYDALNRTTKVAYTDQTINYTYDTGTNGLGRLTGASDANHSMSWTYDGLGRVTGKTQSIGSIVKSVSYGYTNGNRTSLMTPSGQTITFGYGNHRITSIAVNGTTLLSSVAYDPTGLVTGWTWGNNSTSSRVFNTDGNPSRIVTAGVTNTYTVDNASRITGISDSGTASNSFTFGYDALDRVSSGTSSALSRGYTYDANNNLLTSTGTVAFTDTISSSSNRLSSVSGGLSRSYSYDLAGNTTSPGSGKTNTFNQRGRLSTATISSVTTSYIYDALGELIEKTGGSSPAILVYDEVGHIVGEYSTTGVLIQETIWLGEIPVATLRPNGSAVSTYYVHSDHLGTPRKVTRPSDNGLMWRWDPDTYGIVQPNGNPASLGAFTYNLRFPGQYYLAESGLFYNYFRNYDPQVARYIESDPIGLQGGNNTYVYVRDNPLSGRDPNGLEVRWSGKIDSFGATVGVGGQLSTFTLESECKCNKKYKISGFASILTIGAGAKIPGVARLLGDAAMSRSATEFYDPWDECPNPDAANGVAWMSGINMIPGVGGTLLGSVHLGWLRSESPLADGPVYGLDASIQSGMGASAVTSVQRTSCCGK